MKEERAGLGSGSGYARDKHCAANRKMERIAKETGKEPPSEKDAEDGDVVHQILVYPDPAHPCHPRNVTPEQYESAMFLADRQAKIWDEFLAVRVGGNITPPIREKRFWLYKGVTPIRSSKPDFVLVVMEPDGADILIIDHKTGHAEIEPQEADTWAQLEEYALTVAINTQHPRGIKRVRAVINSRWSGVHSKDFPPEYLIAVHRELLATIAAGGVKDPKATPGWYCRYCSGRLVCPSAVLEIELVERRTALPLPEGKEGEVFIDQVKRVNSLCDQILRHYKKRLYAEPGCVGAWQVSEGDEYRSIKDLEGAFMALVSDGRITQDEFMECCDGHIGKLEKKYCNRAKKPAVQAKQDFNDLLADCIEMKRRAGSLEKVKESI